MSFSSLVNALKNLRGATNPFAGRDGDIVFSKNNVCVHNSVDSSADTTSETHQPGYLSVHCQNDAHVTVTLVLQWLPNTTLERNPHSIRTISPCRRSLVNGDDGPDALTPLDTGAKRLGMMSSTSTPTALADRATLTVDGAVDKRSCCSSPVTSCADDDEQQTVDDSDDVDDVPSTPSEDTHSRTLSACSNPGFQLNTFSHPLITSPVLLQYKRVGNALDKTPEQFAQEHNLMLNNSAAAENGGESVSITITNTAQFCRQPIHVALFSVDLGKMRSLRLFYSDPPACTSGQLVIASHESQYKILHFHHGGLDKLALVFEQWQAVTGKTNRNSADTDVIDRQFFVCQAHVQQCELDAEDGLFEPVRALCTSPHGHCEALSQGLNHRTQPLLLHTAHPGVCGLLAGMYEPVNWTYRRHGTITQSNLLCRLRELCACYRLAIFVASVRVDINNSRATKDVNLLIGGMSVATIESMIQKDVVRTDRLNPYYAGDDNANMDVMKNILLNYAVFSPDIGYIQGMSDLLAPLLATLDDESHAFWCFAGLVQRTVFVQAPNDSHSIDTNITYLLELLKYFTPKFYVYLERMGVEALELVFTHRWMLLCFKREFAQDDVLKMWEACWAEYRTRHFHLFISAAIVSVYGDDCVEQMLPHDEMLLYFTSLAMHMDAKQVMMKARGLLYQLCRSERVPCTIVGLLLYDTRTSEHATDAAHMWDAVGPHTAETLLRPRIDCVNEHPPGTACPWTDMQA